MSYLSLWSINLLLVSFILQKYDCAQLARGYGKVDGLGLPKVFDNETLNLILYGLGVFIVVLLVLILCCLCYCCCCRKPQEEELAITPSELVAIGATPSDLKAANISPSVLKESGATYSQMAKLGATPSQLVEAGADKKDLVKLGATQSQLSHVGFHRTNEKPKKVGSGASVPPQTVTAPNKPSQMTKKGSKMTELATSMAEKLKPKKSKKVSNAEEGSAVPSTTDKKPIMSTVSVSPTKRAEALKPTDDSMSMAMGPQQN